MIEQSIKDSIKLFEDWQTNFSSCIRDSISLTQEELREKYGNIAWLVGISPIEIDEEENL